MTLTYLKEQIKEELDGARQYIEKAIEAKISRPAWSRMFVSMADAETDHAVNLMKMMENLIREAKKNETKINSPDSSMINTPTPEDVYKNCMKELDETMAYVTNMKRGL